MNIANIKQTVPISKDIEIPALKGFNYKVLAVYLGHDYKVLGYLVDKGNGNIESIGV